jgi:hypothetical protein
VFGGGTSWLLNNPFSPRLLKKVQMQGGDPKAERGVLEVRRSECQGEATPQMSLFQQPVSDLCVPSQKGLFLDRLHWHR